MYRMDTHGPDELSAQDPFGGRGAFLPHTGSGQEILEALAGAFGLTPAIAWPERGAWLDLAPAGLTAAEATGRWEAAGHALPAP